MYASDNDEDQEYGDHCAECGKTLPGHWQGEVCEQCAREADAYDRARDDKLDGLDKEDW